MRYLALLGIDETRVPPLGTPERNAIHAAYAHFADVAGPAIVGGGALKPTATATTVRHTDDGEPLVTTGPFAETAEALGGYYVLEAATLDDALELAREIPSAKKAWVGLRPMVAWQASDDPPAGDHYLAVIYGKESDADVPGTVAWEDGAAAHGRFAELAGTSLVAGGALHPIDTTTTVRVRDGELLVTDGPFTEVAEVVGGFYLLAAPSQDRAVELATAIPVGPGGAVEVRPIAVYG